MRRWLFENSLSIAFLVLFLATVVGQSFAGQHVFNEEQRAHWFRDRVARLPHVDAVCPCGDGELAIRVPPVLSLHPDHRLAGAAGIERVQGPGEIGTESDQEQRVKGYAPPNAPAWAKLRDWRRRVYENSLLLAMFAIFLLSWLAQSLTGWRVYNQEQLEHHASTIGWGSYLIRSDFWESTLQNWQSEFLAVGSMAVFTIYLRHAAHPNRSPSAHHTTRPAPRADKPTETQSWLLPGTRTSANGRGFARLGSPAHIARSGSPGSQPKARDPTSSPSRVAPVEAWRRIVSVDDPPRGLETS